MQGRRFFTGCVCYATFIRISVIGAPVNEHPVQRAYADKVDLVAIWLQTLLDDAKDAGGTVNLIEVDWQTECRVLGWVIRKMATMYRYDPRDLVNPTFETSIPTA